MTTPEEKQILELLAKEWRFTGPPGILDISTVFAGVAMAPSQATDALKTLFEKGLVDMNTLKTSVFLTPEGFDRADGAGPE